MITLSTPKSGSYHHGDLRAALVGTALDLIEESGIETKKRFRRRPPKLE